MSGNFIDPDDFQPLKSKVYHIKQRKKHQPSDREQYLSHIPPAYLTPNFDRDDPFYIGGHFVPIKEMRGSVMYLGISRCGKTLQLKPSIATSISSIQRRGFDRRAVIADAKQDMLPFVAELTKKLGIPLYYFNLADKRSIAYHIAEDIGGRSDKAREAALGLIPTPKGSEPFWSQAAQTLAHAGMLRLHQLCGTNWGLHDLYPMALMSIPQMITFLSGHPTGRQVAEKYLPDGVGDNTKFGFISQLSSALEQIETAAAAQYYTPKNRWLSMSRFLKSESVLLFGTNTDTRRSSNPIFQIMFQNLVNKINLKSDSSTRKTFIFLDELPFWGKLSGIGELLTFSPSKGAVTSLVCQDTRHLSDIYGENMASAMLGNCQNSLLFAPASSQSAEWAVRSLGKREFETIRFSTNFSPGGISENESNGVETTYPLTDGELRDLGLADPRSGSRFVLKTIWNDRPFIKYMSAQEINKWKPDKGNTPLFIPRSSDQLELPASNSTDFNRLRTFLNETLTNQQLEEQFLSAYPLGSERYTAQQAFKVMKHVMTHNIREFLEFYGRHY